MVLETLKMKITSFFEMSGSTFTTDAWHPTRRNAKLRVCKNFRTRKLMVPQLVKRFLAFYGTRSFNYSANKNLPLFSVLSQMYPIYALPSYYFSTLFKISLPTYAYGFKVAFCFRFTHQNPICNSRHTCHIPRAYHPSK